ncbi:DYW_deaminase domain-containing protein [Psidium guajava]|nr:DYW_deaminase domain-containing protein [Psidium guajava]
MAETSVHGAIHCKPSGEQLNRTERIPPPPPSSPGDLISALPEDVIHRIFSFLPLRDVVRTSVLSERWRSTWTSITDLVFDDMSAVDDDRPWSMLLELVGAPGGQILLFFVGYYYQVALS